MIGDQFILLGRLIRRHVLRIETEFASNIYLFRSDRGSSCRRGHSILKLIRGFDGHGYF